MRARGIGTLALGLTCLAGATRPASAQPELVERLLAIKPTQGGVDYDVPADKAALAACQVEPQKSADGAQISAYIVRDGQGKILRRFIDLDGKLDDRKAPTFDQFGYYQDGFEVYRESDTDGDKKLDDCRWMNAGGTRILKIRHDREKVALQWIRLSAEEASRILVQSLISADLPLLESVMATADELSAVGAPEGLVAQVSASLANRREQVVALRGQLKGWDGKTTWSRFDGMMPRAIPADVAKGLKHDIVLYENAVVFASPGSAQADPTKLAYLQVQELVKVGDTWKFVGLPQAIDPTKPAVASNAEGIRAWLYRESGSAVDGRSRELIEAEKALAEYQNKQLPSVNPADPRSVVKYHYGRLALLREVLKSCTKPEDQTLYNKQIVDDLATCYQTGLFAEGSKLLDDMIKLGGKVASYAAFRKILSEYAMDDNPANPLAHQKAYMAKLEGFLKDFGKSDEAADALLQLASNHEFNAEEDEAKDAYARLTRDFPDSEPAKKAAGALKRLDLVGKPLALRGAGLKGETVDLAQSRGKTVLVVFWHSAYEPVRRELPELMKMAQKHKDKGLVVVGVNLDGGDKATVESFLRENPLPWPQIVEPQGMDGRLANEFGILSLPTLFLVDPQGKVVNRTLRTATELDRLMERSVANRSDDLGIK